MAIRKHFFRGLVAFSAALCIALGVFSASALASTEPYDLSTPTGPTSDPAAQVLLHSSKTAATSRGVTVKAWCSAECTVRVQLTLTSGAAHRAGVKPVIASKSFHLAENVDGRLKVRPAPSVARKLQAADVGAGDIAASVSFERL